MMNRHGHRIKAGLSMICLFVALALAVPAGAISYPAETAGPLQQNQPYARVMEARAPVYAGPGLGFWQLGALRRDVITPVTGVSADGQFWQSNTPIGMGYLRASDVIVSFPENVPLADPGPIGTITTGAANVRTGPGIGAASRGILYEGAQFFIIGRQPDGSWLEIRSQIGRGWVNASLTNVGGTPAVDQVPPSTEGPIAIINTAYLTVRSGPSVQYTLVTTLRGGERVPIVGRNEDGSWLLVQTAAGRGWVNIRYVLTRDYFGNAPVSPIEGSGVTPGYSAITRTGVNLRSGPGLGFASIGVLTTGTHLNVLGQSPDRSWWYVESPLGPGWIAKSVVRTAGDFSRLPIVTP
jgi:uncharacterized protein YraI